MTERQEEKKKAKRRRGQAPWTEPVPFFVKSSFAALPVRSKPGRRDADFPGMEIGTSELSQFIFSSDSLERASSTKAFM